MAKIKSSRESMAKITNGAALRTNKNDEKLINRTVYKISPEIYDTLKKHNLKFSPFALMAVREKLLRDGYMN